MANTDFPSGAIPIKYKNGKSLQNEVATISATNAAIYPGDTLELHTDGYARVIETTTPTKVLGVAAEYKAANSGGEVNYYPAQDLVFRMQGDGSDIDAQTDFDLTYAITNTTGDTTTLRSKQEIDTDATDATDYPVIIRKVASTQDYVANALGANVELICEFNDDVIF